MIKGAGKSSLEIFSSLSSPFSFQSHSLSLTQLFSFKEHFYFFNHSTIQIISQGKFLLNNIFSVLHFYNHNLQSAPPRFSNQLNRFTKQPSSKCAPSLPLFLLLQLSSPPHLPAPSLPARSAEPLRLEP